MSVGSWGAPAGTSPERVSEFEDLRLLRRMRMGCTRVALELLDHCVAERALRKHSLDRLLEHAAGEPRLHFAERPRRDAARIAAVAVIELPLHLVAGDADLFDIGDDDEVAGIHVRRKDRLVLAAQSRRDLGREPAEHLVGRVDDVPGARDIAGPGGEGLHRGILWFLPGRCLAEKSAKSMIILSLR